MPKQVKVTVPLTQADFDAVADELDGRPRHTPGLKTPPEALAEVWW